MAGKIIADTIEASGSQISLNVGNTTILTASSTGLTLIPTTNVNVNLTNSIVTLTAGSATSPGLTFSGNTSTGLFIPAANTVAFTTAATERVRIDSSGNVGIGTNSPTNFGSNFRLMEVKGSDYGVIQATSSNGSTTVEMMGASGSGLIGTRTNHPLVLRTYDTERMRIDTSGNVGIGTSSPSYALDIRSSSLSGALGVNLTSGTTLTTAQGSTTNVDMAFVTKGAGLYTWTQGSTERMRIDSSGNLLVGATNTTLGTVGCQLFGAGYYQATSNGAPAMILKRGSNDGAIVDFYDSLNNRRGYINVTTSATTYNTISDYRLKENVTPMTNALAKVQALKPVTYTWKANGSSGQGFIAHELQSVIPDCVTGEKDAVNEDGNPQYQGIDTSFLVATLTAAIQELNAKVEAQAAEIAALKAK